MADFEIDRIILFGQQSIWFRLHAVQFNLESTPMGKPANTQ